MSEREKLRDPQPDKFNKRLKGRVGQTGGKRRGRERVKLWVRFGIDKLPVKKQSEHAETPLFLEQTRRNT